MTTKTAAIPTLTEIMERTHAKSPYYFEPDTMKFFNQTLEDFTVTRSPTGRIFVHAPSVWHGRLMGYSFTEFVDDDLVKPRGDDDKLLKLNTQQEVLDYIKAH